MAAPRLLPSSSRRRAAHALVLGFALASLGPTQATAQFVVPEGSNFHNGSSLPLEDTGAGRERLGELAAALDRADISGVLAALTQLRAERNEGLVPFGSRTWTGALDRAAHEIVASGQPALLERVLAAEREALAAARRERDLPALLDRATRGRALPTAREAALLAARLLHEQGHFAQARVFARRAGDLPDAEALAHSAAAHLAAAQAAPVLPSAELRASGSGPLAAGWRLFGGLRVRPGEDGDIALPTAALATPRSLLVLHGRYLAQLELGGSQRPAQVLDLLAATARDPARMFVPAPRAFTLARAGRRWILPYDLILGTGWRLATSTRQAHLLAVDLSDTGELSLAWDGQPAFDAVESVAFGPPLVVDGRVFSLVYRVGLATEVSLAAFALDTGKRLFETPLVRGHQVRRHAGRMADSGLYRQDKRAVGSALAERDGVLHACTGFGVYAAVDAVTGAIRHAFRYDRVFSLEAGTFDPAFLLDTGGWDDEPVRLFGERVIVAPSDSRFLYMLAEEPGPRGQLILEDPIEKLDRLHIVALERDETGGEAPVVLATRRRARRGGLVRLAPDGQVREASPLLPDGAPGPPGGESRFLGHAGLRSWITGRALAVTERGPGGEPRVVQVLIPTVDGVVALDPNNLAAPPVALPASAQAPRAVVTLALDGPLLVSFAPQPETGLGSEPLWSVHWYLRKE